jgi:predicted porin
LYQQTGNKATFGLKMSDWSAGVTLSTIDNGNTKKTNSWIISGAYALGQTTLKASYGASSESSSGAADDLTAAAIEADYAFDKDFPICTYCAVINNSKKAKGTFAAANNFPAFVNAGDRPTALSFGICYNF